MDVGSVFDLDRAWRLDPQVSLRAERFGALAYHYGTRRLSFLKSQALYTVVASLALHSTARRACQAAGVGDQEIGDYERALGSLADAGMIRPDRLR